MIIQAFNRLRELVAHEDVIKVGIGDETLIDQGQDVILEQACRRHVRDYDAHAGPLLLSEFETWYDVALIAIGLDFFDVATVVPGVPPPPFQICTGLKGSVGVFGDVPVLNVDILLFHSMDRRSVLQIGPSANPLDHR
ncbi:hypothetical protein D3C81_1378330 [compost metagenome]